MTTPLKIAADYDDPDCNTGMSLAYAVVNKTVAQGLFCMTEMEAEARNEVAGDVAYKLALGLRHQRSIPDIAAIAVAAACARVSEHLGQGGPDDDHNDGEGPGNQSPTPPQGDAT